MIKPIELRTEYLSDPIGIDIERPRLFWKAVGALRQSAYRILAYSGGKQIWDSGKIESDAMHCDFPLPLTSRQRVEWKLTLWDENGEEGEASEAFFEMGLLGPKDWKAEWISGRYSPRKSRRYPVSCFRKVFSSGPAAKARLYISACGLYEARLNDSRVGDFVLAPGSTDYRKRIQYQSYDVTRLLKEGENRLCVELADGWYRGSSGSKGRTNTYGKATKFIAQLEITMKDGSSLTLVTDESWEWSQDGPILFADLKDGERVDARLAPSYEGQAKMVSFHANLTSSDNVPVKEHERFRPLELILTPTGKKVLKFPQNLSGYLSFRLHAREGDKIRIALGEMLDERGEFTLKNVQCKRKGKLSPLQEIDYICKEGINEYKPKFFYGGFQYALIETDVPFEKEDFEAIAVYSDFRETSSFECSNPLINQFYKNTLWSLKSNSTDFPSDCPTRERMGWTGDSQLFFNTASYLVDYASFARKHLRDIYDRQWKSGRLPQIAPYAHEDWFMWTMNGSVGWACAGVYIPYYFYGKYGDRRILEEHYEGMLSYAEFMIKRAGKWGGVCSKSLHLSRKNRKYAVNAGQSYGEWAEPNDVMAFQWYDFASPHPEESTAYTYFTLKHVLEIAEILGKPMNEELLRIKEYSEGAKAAYQELIAKKGFTLDTDRQAKLVRPLYMGLLDPKQEEFAKKRLIKALDHYSWRIGTGFLSTPFILYVLGGIDIELAYRLVENEQMPGWLFMPKMHANTIWESWEGTQAQSGIASLNHYSKGALCQWLFDTCCGIRMGGSPNSFLIAPRPGGHLTFAQASYDSIYGRVTSSWRKEGGKLSFQIDIPCNAKAKIVLPNGQEEEVGAGTHRFEIPIQGKAE